MSITTYEKANINSLSIPGEEWKDVAEYEGLYQVSNFGRVKRLPTTLVEYTGTGTIVNEKTREAYMLTPTVNVHGYYQVGLTKNRKTWSIDVHLLVARAFVPHDEYRNVVHHKDRISRCQARLVGWVWSPVPGVWLMRFTPNTGGRHEHSTG